MYAVASGRLEKIEIDYDVNGQDLYDGVTLVLRHYRPGHTGSCGSYGQWFRALPSPGQPNAAATLIVAASM